MKHLSQIYFLLFIASFVLVVTSLHQLSGQVLYGTVVGNVTDASQAAVPGATVTIINTQTNQTRETQTGDTGAFSFSNVPAGTYTVKVGLPGFKRNSSSPT